MSLDDSVVLLDQAKESSDATIRTCIRTHLTRHFAFTRRDLAIFPLVITTISISIFHHTSLIPIKGFCNQMKTAFKTLILTDTCIGTTVYSNSQTVLFPIFVKKQITHC